jgi:5-formyltetrahydrofolate cyclo-ligase
MPLAPKGVSTHGTTAGPPGGPDDLRAWRRQLRETLLAQRLALPPETIHAYREAIDRHLARGFPNLARGVVAFCWPYKNEHDARFTARRLREAGAVTALPVVVAPRTPLIFREWHPGVALARGVYDIPYPSGSKEVVPDAVLLPMIAFDDAGYRLGYGGGFFDRTLAALARRPNVVGIAYEQGHIPTIYPQAWDRPADFVVTERGVYERREERLEFLGAPGPAGSALASPVCYVDEIDPDYFGPRT